MTTIKNTTKTILFVAILAAMIIPLSTMELVTADKGGDKSKSDHDLFREADKIEKKHKDNFKYDKDGKNKSGNTNDHMRHETIVNELNSRGIFHKSQDQTNIMTGVPVVTTLGNTHQSVDVFLFTPEYNIIETNDTICSTCGEDTHTKKLSIKSGMEWDSPTFPWWEYREESTWSAYTDTTATKKSSVSGDEVNVRPYVMVKADHPITYADFQVLSEVFVMDQNEKLVSTQDITYQYTDIYFPVKTTEEQGIFPTVLYVSASSEHEVTIQLISIK